MFVAQQIGHTQTTFEGDLKSCIKTIARSSGPVGWEIDTVVDDILTFQRDFVTCIFQWKRNLNVAAHVLAKWALINHHIGRLFDSCISDFLAHVLAVSVCPF